MEKNGIKVATALFMVVLFAAGAMSIMAGYGASDDPLITKSYIDSVLTPEINGKIETELAKKRDETQANVSMKLDAHLSAIDKKIAQLSGVNIAIDPTLVEQIANQVVSQLKAEGITSSGSSWQVINLPNGSILTGSVGTELILRSGTANAANGGLVNTSAGTELASGKALAANNLYLVSVDGRGIKGVSGATLLVNGSYKIA